MARHVLAMIRADVVAKASWANPPHNVVSRQSSSEAWLYFLLRLYFLSPARGNTSNKRGPSVFIKTANPPFRWDGLPIGAIAASRARTHQSRTVSRRPCDASNTSNLQECVRSWAPRSICARVCDWIVPTLRNALGIAPAKRFFDKLRM